MNSNNQTEIVIQNGNSKRDQGIKVQTNFRLRTRGDKNIVYHSTTTRITPKRIRDGYTRKRKDYH